MSESSSDSRIDAVAPGDVIALDRGAGEHVYKVVHKEEDGSGYRVTFEGDGGETFQLQLAAGTPVKRTLEAKWESAQSPTPHSAP